MNGLAKDVAKTSLVGLFIQVAPAENRDEHRHHAWMHALKVPAQGPAVHAGHPQVRQPQVVGPLPYFRQGLLSTLGGIDQVSQIAEEIGHVAASIRVVIYHKYGSGRNPRWTAR